jgi:hypothetical protein
MYDMAKSFKKFLEDKGYPFIKSLDNILNIDTDQLENDPQIGTFFSMGLGSNLWSYQVVGFKKDKNGNKTHAVIKPISADKTYKNDGKMSEIPNRAEMKEKIITIEDLDALMRQSFEPQGQA